jgi:hypothetical protein
MPTLPVTAAIDAADCAGSEGVAFGFVGSAPPRLVELGLKVKKA